MGFLLFHLWSVPITINVVSSNPIQARCSRYSIMFCQWFSPGSPFSSTNKTDQNDIAEILLKVVLNTITQPVTPLLFLQ